MNQEFLQPLSTHRGVVAHWLGRIEGVDVVLDRDEVMRRLRSAHEAEIARIFPEATVLVRAEQIHGNAVAAVPGGETILAPDGLPVIAAVDGLVTNQVGVLLAIYVADCGPIWLSDEKTGAIGLLHSGRKGSEQHILLEALALMKEKFGTQPHDVTAVLGPCIRPPNYEVDIAGMMRADALAAGVKWHDSGLDTDGADCYSYRREMGKTGRMVALMMRKELV